MASFAAEPIASAVVTEDEETKQADNDCEESHTFNQGCCKNHVGANLARRLRLTRNSLHGGTTNAPNTKTCANGCDTCADASAQLCDTCGF